MALKTDLTPAERIKAAYMHMILGVDQQAIAVAFEVNHGRVSEACTALAMCAESPKEARRVMEANDALQQLAKNPER
jgi:hypothetical protein